MGSGRASGEEGARQKDARTGCEHRSPTHEASS